MLPARYAKSCREAQASLGNSDPIINVLGREYLIETKIFRYDRQFQEDKVQLAYHLFQRILCE